MKIHRHRFLQETQSQRATHHKPSTLQQLATNALALASSGDLAGLDELLQSSSEYKEIQFVKNQLRDQLGKDNPGYRSSISRLIALKPQDLIKQAHAAGHTEPSEVKQFAAEAIAKEKGYSKISSSILQSVNTQVDAAQSPPLTTAGERISNTIQTHSREHSGKALRRRVRFCRRAHWANLHHEQSVRTSGSG